MYYIKMTDDECDDFLPKELKLILKKIMEKITACAHIFKIIAWS